jgi:hypothetical protein
MTGCPLCGRPVRKGSRFCCHDHETLFAFAQQALGRIPLSLSEAEAVFTAKHVRKGPAAVEQLPLIANRGR